MSKDDALRDLVAAELEELSAENGLLHAVSDRSTAILFNDSAERLNFREQIAEDYLERESSVDREGYMQVITAGVPGAGKSTTIERLGLDMKGYRVIDADIVKEYLLDDAMKQETYADILGRRLRDGKPIMLMELSGLVHVESASIADLIRRGCLERGENIIVEGTLSWPGLVDRYINEVNDFGYVGLEIVDVEVPAELAKKRALSRWWKDRKTSARSGGGRFTPAAVIDGSFGENRERSVCFDNANSLFSHPKSIDIETITLRIEATRVDGSQISSVSRKHFGHVEKPVEPPNLDAQGTFGEVRVNAHTKANGTVVPEHYRKAPQKR